MTSGIHFYSQKNLPNINTLFNHCTSTEGTKPHVHVSVTFKLGLLELPAMSSMATWPPWFLFTF
jgi:hypothetical protein